MKISRFSISVFITRLILSRAVSLIVLKRDTARGAEISRLSGSVNELKLISINTDILNYSHRDKLWTFHVLDDDDVINYAACAASQRGGNWLLFVWS